MVGKLKINASELNGLLDEKLTEIAEFIFNESQQNIINQGLVDRGTLLASGQIIDNFLNKRIVYTVPYADSIEFGRIPGIMPPIEPIKDWVRRKGLAAEEKQINSIAWAIAQDLKKNGTDPRPFMQPAIDGAKVRFK